MVVHDVESLYFNGETIAYMWYQIFYRKTSECSGLNFFYWLFFIFLTLAT